MAQTISVLVISEDETIETAINNAIDTIEETLCQHTGHYQATAAHPPDHPELYIGAHAQTDRGQELIEESMNRTTETLTSRIDEMRDLFDGTTSEEIGQKPRFHQLCSTIGSTQSMMYDLFDATGHHSGHAITDMDTAEYIIENNRVPVYIVKLNLK